MVGNVGWNEMNKWVKFYEDVMGFVNFLSFDDKQIKELIDRNSIIGVCFDAWMIMPNWKRGVSDPKKMELSLEKVVDHIDHIIKVAGIDHVGIGCDFDGGGGIEGIFDVSEVMNITIELVKRGYSEEQIQKIWGGNIMRVLGEVQEIAQQIQSKEVS